MANELPIFCQSGHANPADGVTRFCQKCDAALFTRCRNGHETPASGRFCANCGTAVSPTGYPEEMTARLPVAGQGIDTIPDSAPASFTSPQGFTTPPSGDRPLASGGSRPKGHRTLLVLIGAVVLLLVLGGAAYAVLRKSSLGPKLAAAHHVSSSTTTSTTTPTTTAPPSTTTTVNIVAQQQAQAMSELLGQSEVDRTEIVNATAQIASCGDLTSAQQILNNAASSRQALLNSLNNLQVAALPNSSQIVTTLSAAWNASLNADNAYSQWASDEQSNFNGCTPNDTSDPGYVQALSSDAQATAAKKEFVSLWNPIAVQYGLPQLTAAQI